MLGDKTLPQSEVITGYKADLSVEWLPLSDLHKKYLERVEEYLTQYCNGNRAVPRIAIVGAYRQGKTQFLFHIFLTSVK